LRFSDFAEEKVKTANTYERTHINPSKRTLRKLFVCLVLIVIFSLTAAGQNMSGMPDYGAYVPTGKIDTYNALNGQIALRLPFSSHHYTGFSYQFGFRYGSNLWHTSQGITLCDPVHPLGGQCMVYQWLNDNEGWRPFSNLGGELKYSDTQYACNSIYDPSSPNYSLRAKYAIRGNYAFKDYASGRIYQFPARSYRKLDNLQCPEGVGTTNALVAPSDEGGMQLDITNDVPGGLNGAPAIYKATANDGTVITGWNANGTQMQRITDVNGNTLTFDGSGNNGVLPAPLEDGRCTPLPQIGTAGTQNYAQFFCYVDANGVTQNIRVDWTDIKIQPAFPTTLSPQAPTSLRQNFFQNGPYDAYAISKITLPNNLAYTFSYENTFGQLTKITLPTGGYIRYTWETIAQRQGIVAPPDPSICCADEGQDVLVLATRSESEDGVNEHTWTYSYGGAANTPWTTTITDPLGSQEVHRFSAGPIALETQTQYLDAGGHVLKQVDKLWSGNWGPVQLGFSLISTQDMAASSTLFAANDSPNLANGLDTLSNIQDDAEASCGQDNKNCVAQFMYAALATANLFPSLDSGIAVSVGAPMSDGAVTYAGARNTVVLSETTTEYSGGQTLVTTVQTDYNDCSTFMNFDPYASMPGKRPTSFSDCSDNPTEIREYGYDKAANNAITNFNSGHSATNAAPASRYTDLSYLHQTNSAFGPATYSMANQVSPPPTGPFLYDTSGSHILDRVTEKKVYDGVNSTASSPASDGQTSYDAHGNSLTKSTWLNTSNTWLTSSFTYDSFGNVLTSKDPNQNVTTYDYTDNYTDSSKNTGTARFATTITLPPTGGVSHVTRKQYDWNTSLVMAVCGENYGGSACTWGQSPAGGPIPDYVTHSYDFMNRPLTVSDGGGGQTSFAYNESSLPISVSMTTRHDSSINVVHAAVLDGLGRTKQTQWVTPECTVKTDTTYDPLGRVSTVSNPYCSTSDSTYGITTTQYDALGRVLKVIPQDGTVSSNNVTTDYSNFPTVTVTDQTGNPRRTTTDAFGRLIRVDEPGTPTSGAAAAGNLPVNGSLRSALVGGHGAAQSSGSVTITGAEQIIYVPGDPVCVMYGDQGCLQWQTPYYPVCDSGTVLLTVGGHGDSTGWGCDATPAGIASGLANAINNDGAALVSATVSGATLNLTSRAAASTANYSWSVSISDGDPADFGAGSFSGSPAAGSMTGGADAFGGNTVYDSGTATLTVGNFSSPPVPYSSTQNSAAAALASAVAQAFTSAPGAPAKATASGATISISYNTLGAAWDVATSVSSTPDNAALFPGGSFGGSTTLSGGDNPDPTGINHPLITLYQYDVLGNLLRVDQKGSAPNEGSKWRTRLFAYNSLSQLLTAQNPESGSITYYYDNAGNVQQKVMPAPNQTGSAQHTISYCYDELNRVTGKAYSWQNCQGTQLPAGTAVVSYAYDQGTNGVGRMTSLTDQAGSGTYSYDAMGRVASEQRVIAGVSKSMSYNYNLDGSLKTLTYPSGATVTYTSDGAGRTRSVVDNGNGINYATSATYGPDGSLTGFVSGQSGTFAGISNSFSYNTRLQPVFMSASAPSQTIFSLGYDFHLGKGNNGNVYAILNNRDHTRDQTFTYDQLNRLMSAQNAGTDCTQGTVNGRTKFWGNGYTYDAWGNLTDKGNLPGSASAKCGSENLHVTADAQNRMHAPVGADYQYDAAGNMTYDASGLYYTYDAENRIIGANGYAYTYDDDGNRVEKSNGSTGTLYWYTSPGIIAESDLSGALKSEYVFFGGDRVARRDGVNGSGGVFYYFSDHLKTASVITDSAGNIKAESDYYPWGAELQFINNDSNHYKFTGKERDTETNLDYFGARYYSNGLGRWISADWSATPIPVPYADFDDPQTLNLYSYVRGLPTTKADLDGHCMEGWFCHSMAVQMWNHDPSGNHAQSKTQILIGAGKELVNMVTSTVNIGLNMAVHNGTYVPGTTPEIPQLEMSNELQVVGAVGAVVTTTVAPLVPEEAAGSTILANAEKGAASEARVLNDLGVAKNTEAVTGAEGKSIPDFQTTKTVGEIKDAKTVSNTKQLRIQKEAAQTSRRQHELHTGTNTHVTKPAAQGTKVVRRDDLGPK
jgi:RHS repeat-associated protein